MTDFATNLDDTLTFTSDKILNTRQKILLSFACLPTNLGWALSESLIIPYLLIIGAPLYVCSWTWFFSPILASYIAPKMDNWCDNWTNSNCWGWRGRKQFILILSIISAITMILLPQSHAITQTMFRTESVALTFIIAMIIFTIMDISFYLLLRPLQALIWDVTLGNKENYMDTMKVFNVIQGICRMTGLIIVAICISFDFVFVGSHIGSAFMISAIMILICTFFSLFYSPNPPELESLSTTGDNTIPFANSGFTSNLFTNLDYDYNQEFDTNEIKHLLDITDYGSSKKTNPFNDVIHDDEYDSDQDNDDFSPLISSPNYIQENRENRYRALHILWLSQLSGWCSMCSVVLFWTSFISIDVYGGIARDKKLGILHHTTYEWLQFKAGLVFGAYGLLLTALVSVNCSVLYPWLKKKGISTRSLYIFGEIGMAILCIIFYITDNTTWLLIFISLFGFFMQIHMQSCHELTENELQPMFTKMRESKTKIYFEYCMELANVIAPVAVSLFGGPMVYAFNGEFKYLFLLAGIIQLIFDSIVLLMFFNLFPWKLPTSPR